MGDFLDFLRHIDQQSFLAIYNYADQIVWLEFAAYYVARYGILLYLIILTWLFYRREEKEQKINDKKAVVYVLISLALAFLVDEIVNLLKVRHRPFVTFPAYVAKLNVVQDLTSFPSTHTIFVFVISFSLYLSNYRKLAYGLMAFAVILGLSRIVAGVHYPFDILGGIVLGAVIPIFVHREGGWFKQKLLNHREIL